MRQTCPKCHGKVRSDGRCRRCEAREKSVDAVDQQQEKSREADREPGDLDADLRVAIAEWDRWCQATTDPREQSCLKLAKVVATLLTHQAGFNKYGVRWLEDAIDPTLSRANQAFGSARPALVLVSAFRDRAAARLANREVPQTASPPRRQSPAVPARQPEPTTKAPASPPQVDHTRARLAARPPIPKAEEIHKQVRTIVSRCTGEPRFHAQFQPVEAMSSETRFRDCFPFWNVYRDDVLDRLESEFEVLFPIDFESDQFQTIGAVERFILATLEHRATAELDAPADQMVVEYDDFTQEKLSAVDIRAKVCRRSVKLAVDPSAWQTGICAKRLRNQLRRQLPEWSVRVCTLTGRHNGLVNLNLLRVQGTEEFHYDLLVTLDDQTNSPLQHVRYPFPPPKKGPRYRVELRASFNESLTMTDLWVFAGCTSGVLLGLLAVGGYWALATFFHFSWLPYPPTPQIIPTGEFEWLRSLAAAVEVCVGAAVVFAVVAGIRNAIWNFFFKRKWNRAAEQRAELQRAVAGLDVVEALSKRVLECPPWAT